MIIVLSNMSKKQSMQFMKTFDLQHNSTQSVEGSLIQLKEILGLKDTEDPCYTLCLTPLSTPVLLANENRIMAN